MKGDSHGSLYSGKIYLAGDRVDWDGVEFDLQVRRSLVECSVGGGGDDPERDVSQTVACLGSRTNISGSVIPLVARAQSR